MGSIVYNTAHAHKANAHTESEKSKDSTDDVTDNRSSCTLGLTSAVAIDGAAIRTGCTVAVACVARITVSRVVARSYIVARCDIVVWSHIVSVRWLGVSVGVSIGVSLRRFVPSCLQVHSI